MILRCALSEDLDAVEEIERLSETNPWSRPMFESELGRSDGRFWVLEITGKILGFAIFRVMDDEAELLSIALHPDCRRRGWGRQILEETMVDLRQVGVEQLWLEVRSGNLPARKLYETSGFVEDGRRPNYYENPREDAVLMTCRL